MRVKLWGVRGSLPSPVSPERARGRVEEVLNQWEMLRASNSQMTARAFLEALPHHLLGGYGGNTSCAEITDGSSRLIIDGGSGIRALGEFIMQNEPDLKEFHIYFTHFHWDHLIGLPFFIPLYVKGKTINFYAVHDDTEDCLRRLFRKPNFPVPYEVVQKQIKIHKVEPRKPFNVGTLKVTPYQLDHPDPSWGARIDCNGKSVAWCVDSEGTRTSREELGQDLPLYTKADLMVFDAQYTFGEAMEKINWGHSSGPVGLDIALREGIKQVLFVHHDPAASDETIREAEEQTQLYYEEILRARDRAGLSVPDMNWRFAREGESVQL